MGTRPDFSPTSGCRQPAGTCVFPTLIESEPHLLRACQNWGRPSLTLGFTMGLLWQSRLHPVHTCSCNPDHTPAPLDWQVRPLQDLSAETWVSTLSPQAHQQTWVSGSGRSEVARTSWAALRSAFHRPLLLSSLSLWSTLSVPADRLASDGDSQSEETFFLAPVPSQFLFFPSLSSPLILPRDDLSGNFEYMRYASVQ